MTSTHSDEECRGPITVERRLSKVCKKLSVTEININMFHRMIKNNVATNDVRSFANNQQYLNRHREKTAALLSKAAMRQKLKDACSTACRLKSEKKQLEKALTNNHGYTKSKVKRVVKKIRKRTSNCRSQHRLKVKKKFEVCRVG